MVHVSPDTLPTLGLPYVTSSSSTGSVSRTTTLVESDEPVLVTVMVSVITPPALSFSSPVFGIVTC